MAARFADSLQHHSIVARRITARNKTGSLPRQGANRLTKSHAKCGNSCGFDLTEKEFYSLKTMQ
jgi:hypothetical protein